MPAYIRPLFCEGKGPFRWVALSGDEADIAATDRAVLEELPDDERLARWMQQAGERIAFQGLPARICWVGYGERHRLGLRFNEMVRSGELKGADRDRARPPRLGVGRVAVPRDRGDGRRVRRDRRLAAAERAGQHGGGRVVGARSTTAAASGIGRSIHAGMVCVADGTDLAAQKLERVLTADPGMGVIRHADAGLRAGDRGGRRARRADPDDEEMSVRDRQVGDPVLRERAREVTPRSCARPRSSG